MGVRPASGEVIEETKRTRILATKPEEEEKVERPEIWEFVESLRPVANLEKPDYEFTIYRGRKAQKSDEKEWLGKFYEPMKREVIQNRFGGGEYNVWLKVGPGLQLRYNVDLRIAGAPKKDSEISAPAPNDAMGQIVAMLREELRELRTARGADLGLEAVRQALALNGQVFSSGATAVQTTLANVANGGGGAHAPGPMDDIMKQFMAAAIAKMLNPADPIENFTKMAQAMSAMGFKMNPMGGGGEKLSDKLVMGLVGQLPALTQHVAGIMDGYRRAEEAKANAAAIARGVQPPINVAPVKPAAPPNVITLPTPTPEAPTPPANAQPTQEDLVQAEQMMQYIERKIVEIITNQSLTPQEAAIQALTFIDVTDPVSQHPDGRNVIDEILAHGKAGLDYVFDARPILKAVPKDDRLEAFKLAFLENGRPLPGPVTMQPDPNTPPA